MAVNLQERRRLRRRRHFFRRIRAIFIAAIFIAAIIIAIPIIGERQKIKLYKETQAKITLLDWVETDLLPVNDYSRPGSALTEINTIVIHYVGNPGTTAAQNRSYYARLADNHTTKASSNFLIGLDGEIIECVPIDEVAYCSNWRNDDTLSIECCHPDETGEFSEETYASLVNLTAWLCRALKLDASDLIRHYDITQKVCPKYYVDHEDAWALFKDDVQNALEELQSQSDT